MNLLQFIRLILRNLAIVLVVPIVIVITVLILSKGNSDTYKSYTTIYTGFASGYSIQNGEQNKIDFHDINISFDNLINVIKARETKEEVALRLLAHHIFLNKVADKTISQVHLDRLNTIVTPDLILKVLDKKSEENTFNNLVTLKNQDETNELYTLLNNEKEVYYSVFAIEEIKISRMESSDMIKLEFESNDPGVCQDVLNIICRVFIKKFKALKQGEINNVSTFFEMQTKSALGRLNAAEEKIKNFRSQNKVINYYEQTKFISEKREDLVDELNKEKMVLASAEAAISNAEEKLGNSSQIVKTSAEILNKRNQIVDINSKLVVLQNDPNAANADQIGQLNLQLNKLKNELEDKVTNLFSASNSKEGISHKELASVWLENAIAADESKARLPIYSKRLDEIETTYDQFAPMGSNLNKMEREIGIAEKEYLNHLSSLSAAKLREQDVTMSNNIQVVDPAFYPLKPLPNAKKVLVMAAGVVGLFITILILVMTELLDQTLKSPERAQKLIEKTVIGGLPTFNKQSQFLVESGAINRMIDMICNKVYQYIRLKPQSDKPFILSLVSTSAAAGKTSLAIRLQEQFKASGKRVLLLVPDANSVVFENNENIIKYTTDLGYSELESLNQLLPEGFDKTNYDIVIIEFLPFFIQKSPVGLANECDLSILVARANKLWEEADKNALNYYTDTYTKPVFVVMNHLTSHLLESFIGELPRKRSKIRQRVKKWIKLDFSAL